MQLQPTEQFTISRQLADPNDTDTNYVRAVVRNALTDQLLKTLPLTEKGGATRRFTGTYEIPADLSGQGFYITITTTVFTDAAFTSLNPNYSEEQNTYLVQTRVNHLGGGGGGADIDYKKIKELIEAAVALKAKEIIDAMPKTPKAKEINMLPVFQAIADLGVKIAKIPTETPSLTPVVEAVRALQKSVDALPTEIPEYDEEGLIDAFTASKELLETLVGLVEDLPTKSKAALGEDFKKLEGGIGAVKRREFTLKPVPLEDDEEEEMETVEKKEKLPKPLTAAEKAQRLLQP